MIGVRIRNLRIEKGMKQSELAEMTGISRISIGNYERGDRQPPVDVAAKIADALDVTVDYLLGLPDKQEDGGLRVVENKAGHDLYYEIVQGAGRLPKEDQRELLVLIEAKLQRIDGTIKTD